MRRGGSTIIGMLLCFLSGCGGSDSPPPAVVSEGPGGPRPVADLTVYGSGQGLTGDVIDAGPDAAQNMWVVTPDSLYVQQAGKTTFQRFTAADGLHIQSFIDPSGKPATTNITALAGGRAGEVFVGYFGYESDDRWADFGDPRRALGQADRVTLNGDGTLQILRYKFQCDNIPRCWENRSVRRMVFAHQGIAEGHLFIGGDHGVIHVYHDTFGDHVHVETIWLLANGGNVLKIGEEYGLAVLPSGDLLTASGYGVGVQSWNPAPKAWVNESFVWAFTTHGPAEPYNNGKHDLLVPEGYREDNRGAAVTPDGTAWWVSLRTGLSSYNPVTAGGNFDLIHTWDNIPRLPTSGLLDVASDPDGTLWIVDNNGRLLRFDPSTSTVQVWPGVSNAHRVVMDTTVIPRALYVSMGVNGLAVIRAK